uniref:Protein LURP-one-related 11 n=1 Tax=Oryza meridionalis TaxID=40149 RepID=A0A0E0CCK9_9ORYZ
MSNPGDGIKKWTYMPIISSIELSKSSSILVFKDKMLTRIINLILGKTDFLDTKEMAIAPPRIQPVSAHLHSSASPKDSDHQEKQEVCYTVWMKSLVFNGRGCTVYGQDGRAAYRVDNYACRRSRENFGVFKTWQGYSCCNNNNGDAAATIENQPWFRVQKEYKILKKEGRYNVRAVVEVALSGEVYRVIDGASHKSEYRIVGAGGEVLAEIRRKQTDAGVVLGDDVLTLTVGPTADRLLVVGLVVVCGLLDRCI